MLTQMNRIWSRAKWLAFPKSTENSAQEVINIQYHFKETLDGARKNMYQYQKHEGERQIPQDEQLDHVKCQKTSVIILKQEIILQLFFFKAPNTKTVQANKICSKFSGIPDVKFSFILGFFFFLNQCICNIGK